jgi:hypothetical protein
MATISVAQPALGDGIVWYAALKDHAATCDDCLAELTLAIVALRVCGELVFEPHYCSEGDRLLGNVSRSMQRGIWPNPLSLRGDGSATKPPGQGAVANSRIKAGGH